ncbi:hypothetical protein SANTM175S_02937 [Streptomyces antimycoticus]
MTNPGGEYEDTLLVARREEAASDVASGSGGVASPGARCRSGSPRTADPAVRR